MSMLSHYIQAGGKETRMDFIAWSVVCMERYKEDFSLAMITGNMPSVLYKDFITRYNYYIRKFNKYVEG